MASDTFPFDLSKLLLPISADAPSGAPLAYEGTYDRIRETRRHDDPSLDQGVWQTTLKKAEWDVVEKICMEALEKQTKDLQIAAWLLEAWMHLYGFAGVREGIRLENGLCAAFWETVYPLPDGADLEPRLAPIIWLNDKIPPDLKMLTITEPESPEVPPYRWADWDEACRPRPPKQQQRGRPVEEDESAMTQAKFQKSALLTPTVFFVGLAHDLESLTEACGEFEATLDRKCGPDSPSLRQFWTVVEPIHSLVMNNLGQREPLTSGNGATESHEAEQLVDQGGEEIQDGGGHMLVEGRIRSRADAYRRLAEAADYLARTEPHSPAPYLVRRAIFWGSMKFEELLPELVRDRGELSEIYRLLQIKNPEERD